MALRGAGLTKALLITTALAMIGTAVAVTAEDAGGVRLTLGVSERLETISNPGPSIPSSGSSNSASTRLTFSLSSVTRTDSLSLKSDLGLVARRTSANGTEVDFDTPGLSLSYGRTAANSSFSLNASYSRDRIETLLPLDSFIDDEGNIDLPEDPEDLFGTGFRERMTLGTSLSIGTSSPFGLTFSANQTETRYSDVTDPDLVAKSSTTLGVTGRLRFSDLTTGTVSLSQTMSDTDDAVNTQEDTRSVTLGLSHAISPTLSLTSKLSYSKKDTEKSGITTSTDSTNVSLGFDYVLKDGSLAVDLGPGRASLAWKQKLSNGAVSLSLSHVDDKLDDSKTDQIGLRYNRSLSAVSGMQASLLYTKTAEPGANSVARTDLSLSYNHALTEDWGLNVGLAHRVRDEETVGSADSTSIFVSLGRSFDLSW